MTNRIPLLVFSISFALLFIFSPAQAAVNCTCPIPGGATEVSNFDVVRPSTYANDEAYCKQVLCQTLTGTLGDACRKNGNCDLNDLVSVVATFITRIFAFIGAIILIFLIYGGIVFLTAAGHKDRVAKGQQIITQAIIGLAILFLSYTIVGLVFKTLDVPGYQNFASTDWFKVSN